MVKKGIDVIRQKSPWTVDTMATFLNSRIDERSDYLSRVIEERDRAYLERWQAQETNVIQALAAQKENVHYALVAAKEAVAKAEVSSEKRFDSVAEGLEQGNRIASQLLPRAEFDRVTSSINDKLEVINRSFIEKMELNAKAILEKSEQTNKAFGERIDDLRSYKDKTVGTGKGTHSAWIYLLGFVSLMNTLIGMIGFFKKP